MARVWHAPKAVIAHNELSGSSAQSDAGRHALKLHGPHESELVDPGSAGLDGRTQYVILADNLIGQSGPWPIGIGPQDGGQDERLSDLVVERNRFYAGFGTPSCCSSPVQVSLMVWADHTTIRNNIFTGEGSSKYFTGITVARRGVEPAHRGNRILNNTFYKVATEGSFEAVVVESGVSDTLVRNNLVQFSPGGVSVKNQGVSTVADNNHCAANVGLVDSDNANFLAKDFRPGPNSPAIDAGVSVPVFDDFACASRPVGTDDYDLGAFEVR